MKIHRKVKGALLALIMGGVAYFGTVSCERADLNPDYPFEVTVKSRADSLPLANVKVEVFAPVSDSDIRFEGYTDIQGQVSFEYDKNAIFVVRALRGKAPNYTWIACGEIRLKANEVATTTVYLQRYNPNVVGCYL